LPHLCRNFHSNSKIAYTFEMVLALRDRFGRDRIVGVKDSAGQMRYAVELAQAWDDFDVFPSNEACLLDARAGRLAGCISASANINAPWCRKAWAEGDAAAPETAKIMGAAVSRHNLIVSVRAVCAEIFNDPAVAEPMPPLVPLATAERQALLA